MYQSTPEHYSCNKWNVMRVKISHPAGNRKFREIVERRPKSVIEKLTKQKFNNLIIKNKNSIQV